MDIVGKHTSHLLNFRKVCEFRAIIGRYGFKHFIKVFAVSFPKLLHCFYSIAAKASCSYNYKTIIKTHKTDACE